MKASNIGHPAAAILRAVADLARIGAGDREKPMMIIEGSRSTDWASITFTGQRHEFDLRFEGVAEAVDAAVAHLCAVLAEHDMPLAGHFVAEIGVAIAGKAEPSTIGESTAAICTTAQRLQVAALTVRD